MCINTIHRWIYIFQVFVALTKKMNTEMEKLDIDSIFMKYTINEIRDIEEKIKDDMERKKEELRSMVG